MRTGKGAKWKKLLTDFFKEKSSFYDFLLVLAKIAGSEYIIEIKLTGDSWFAKHDCFICKNVREKVCRNDLKKH